MEQPFSLLQLKDFASTAERLMVHPWNSMTDEQKAKSPQSKKEFEAVQQEFNGKFRPEIVLKLVREVMRKR